MPKLNLNKLNFRFFKRLPAYEKKITLSTMITLFRIIVTPFIVGAMSMQYWGVACVLFIAASLSDLVDGYLARLRGEKTFLGACLDPIADKILILCCFFTLAFVPTPLFAIPKWFVWFVLLKEFTLVAGVLGFYMLKGHVTIKPRLIGKLTTFVQMIFIMWLFACYFFQWMPVKTYYGMLGVLFMMISASFVQYAIVGLRGMKS